MPPSHQTHIDAQGNLVLPADLARKYGLAPGSELRIEEKAASLTLRPPITHLGKVYLEPTSRCNLSCRTCIRNAWEEPLGKMAMTTFNRLIDDLHSLPAPPAIFFGGFGEPLAHPRILDMVARASQVSDQVELITNGMLLSEARSLALIEAGLHTLWVSVDGATPESYADIRLGAALPNIFKNLTRYHDLYRQIKGGEPRIGIVFVAMKRNIADLPDLLRMSTRLGVSRYLVTNVLPYTREMCNEMLYTRSVDIIASQPSLWSPYLDFPPMDVDQHTRDPLLRMLSTHRRNFFVREHPGETSNRCPFIRQRATAISWNGEVSPCLPLMHSHPSYLQGKLRAVQRHVVGSLQERPLSAWYADPAYVAFRQRVDDFDFSPCTTCAACELSENNQEDCFGNLFPTCGGCLWAQGFIRCP